MQAMCLFLVIIGSGCVVEIMLSLSLSIKSIFHSLSLLSQVLNRYP